MAEFFIALIGGIYILMKFITERSESAAYDRDMEEEYSMIKLIKEQFVADKDAVFEVLKKIGGGDINSVLLLTESISDNLISLFGKAAYDEALHNMINDKANSENLSRVVGVYKYNIYDMFSNRESLAALILSSSGKIIGKINGMDFAANMPYVGKISQNAEIDARVFIEVEKNLKKYDDRIVLILEDQHVQTADGKCRTVYRLHGSKVYAVLDSYKYTKRRIDYVYRQCVNDNDV